MKNLVRESLNEQQNRSIDLQEEISNYTDLDGLQEDPEYLEEFEKAISEFGISIQNVGVISSYAANADWEDIKNELDKQQIEYYEFDLHDGERAILVSMYDFDKEDEE